ncbi:hypothetical protein QE152_g9244 [Popillia japonica]|uniref:Uncharacterized protein n=1 Tax=Popillia japonica TaxID=7064 RepID=A0AAW1LY59_POPJA
MKKFTFIAELSLLKAEVYASIKNLLKAEVYASMKNRAYNVEITLDVDGQIKQGSCTCPRGQFVSSNFGILSGAIQRGKYPPSLYKRLTGVYNLKFSATPGGNNSAIKKPLSATIRSPATNSFKTPQLAVIFLSEMEPGYSALAKITTPFGATPIKPFKLLWCL